MSTVHEIIEAAHAFGYAYEKMHDDPDASEQTLKHILLNATMQQVEDALCFCPEEVTPYLMEAIENRFTRFNHIFARKMNT